MTIKIITCSRAYNLGAVLQTYALQEYLSFLNLDVEVIDYNPDYFRKNVSYTYVGSFSNRSVLLKLGYILYKFPQRVANHIIFNKFLQKCIKKTDEYHSFADLCEADLKADVFICGSDQIWCPTKPTGKDDAMYLHFVKNSRKISYAASFGEKQLTNEFLQSLVSHLADFSHISVRESSGVTMLESVGIKAIQVLDPVFLLQRRQWDDFSTTSYRYKKYGRYVLVYPMSVADITFIINVAQELAEKYNYSVVVIGKGRKKQVDYNVNDATPQDFVSLVKHASCVLTNSFHGTAFSIIFNKDFIVCGKEMMPNSRIESLLDLTHLSDRYINVEKSKVSLSPINYDLVNHIIDNSSNISKEYLKNAVGVK